MIDEKGLSRNDIVAQLLRSPHEGKTVKGEKLTDEQKLSKYLPVGVRAAAEEGEFFAHMIAWNRKKGEIRDTKVGLPVIALTSTSAKDDFRENALAHLATLDPRNLMRAVRFGDTIRKQKLGRSMLTSQTTAMVERYLRAREADYPWWERSAVQHRESMTRLYSTFHIKPAGRYEDILFQGGSKKRRQPWVPYPTGSVFEAIANLRHMSAAEAAGAVIAFKIPFLVARPALGAKAMDPDFILALIRRMSPTELVTNMKMLERMGVKTNPITRAALEEALDRASKSKANILKTSVAADAVEDPAVREKLLALQERQIETHAGIEGDWAIFADKSGSMHQAIEAAAHVAATLTRMVKGEVHLIFFDSGPRYISATGKTLEQLRSETKHVTAGGGTAIGSAMQYLIDNKIVVGGIALLSDGGENGTPLFVERYQFYTKKFDVEPTLYFYRFRGSDPDTISGKLNAASITVTTADIPPGFDYVAMPSLIEQMRTNRYSLIDEIFASRLLTLDDVFSRKEVRVSA